MGVNWWAEEECKIARSSGGIGGARALLAEDREFGFQLSQTNDV